MAPELANPEELARLQARARALLLLTAPFLLAPLISGFLGGGHEYLQSGWWASLRLIVWLLFGATFAGISIVDWTRFLTIWRLLPVDKRPPENDWTPWRPTIAVVILLVIGGWWVNGMQADILPKLLHGFSHPEHASVRFTTRGGLGSRLRYECRNVDIVTVEYGVVGICEPPSLRGRFDRPVMGTLGGSKTIYGFWIENVFLDGVNQ